MTVMGTADKTSLLRFSRPARFIRWHRSRDERWYPEILHGRYDGRHGDGWSVLTDGGVMRLSEHEWTIYRD